MSLLEANFDSTILHRMVNIRVYLPVDSYQVTTRKNKDIYTNQTQYLNAPDAKFQTIYLLHGLTDNNTAWIANTRILQLAKKYNLAVIMPNGENSFYIDQPQPHHDFGRYIGEELVEITRRMFPLSRKREDTMIGGLSMGGFGALRNGLSYPDTFGKIIALSSAIHMFEQAPDDPTKGSVFGEEACLGDWEISKKTTKNPAFVLNKLAMQVKEGRKQYPEIYMSCGTEDGLLAANRSFSKKLQGANVPVLYRERPGKHEWSVWDEEIEMAFDHFMGR